jgi:hypothetical protein
LKGTEKAIGDILHRKGAMVTKRRVGIIRNLLPHVDTRAGIEGWRRMQKSKRAGA